MALLSNKSREDLDQDRGTDQLWDPNQGKHKGRSGADAGLLAGIAAMIIMIVMYPGRVARLDLLQCVCFLAKRITRWDLDCDRRLHRLIGYVAKVADGISFGWIGAPPRDLTSHLFADAILAECPYTLKSGSGVHFDVQGPNSRFPISVGCSTQTSIASSSIASEISALNGGMKNRSEPAIKILPVFLA